MCFYVWHVVGCDCRTGILTCSVIRQPLAKYVWSKYADKLQLVCLVFLHSLRAVDGPGQQKLSSDAFAAI